jgi:enoyl-CoA hydratase/carnithine racemase
VNWKPVIAAPHGFAVGLGLGLTMESDLVVAEAGTKFQVAETKRGLAASRYWALMNLRGGSAFATEMALTGGFFTAEQALAAGVINRVAPPGDLMAVARALASELAANPPLSVRATVRTRRWYMEQAEKEAYLQTDPLKLHLTEDFAESARAFAEKRKPAPFRAR